MPSPTEKAGAASDLAQMQKYNYFHTLTHLLVALEEVTNLGRLETSFIGLSYISVTNRNSDNYGLKAMPSKRSECNHPFLPFSRIGF
jgi:hypothetical protein